MTEGDKFVLANSQYSPLFQIFIKPRCRQNRFPNEEERKWLRIFTSALTSRVYIRDPAEGRVLDKIRQSCLRHSRPVMASQRGSRVLKTKAYNSLMNATTLKARVRSLAFWFIRQYIECMVTLSLSYAAKYGQQSIS